MQNTTPEEPKRSHRQTYRYQLTHPLTGRSVRGTVAALSPREATQRARRAAARQAGGEPADWEPDAIERVIADGGQSIRHRAGRFSCAHPDCQLRYNNRGGALACCGDRPLPGDLVADGGRLEDESEPEPDLPERPKVQITRHHRRGDPEPWLIIRSADDPSAQQRLSIHECDLVEVPR